MKIFLVIFGVAIMLFATLSIIGCMKVSSNCSRQEEIRIQEQQNELSNM